MRFIHAYLGSLLVFVALDAVWLGYATHSFYPERIGHLMSDSPNWMAAFAFYGLYLVGVVILAVTPGIEKESLPKTALLGALFGLVAYGTFDMTNQAVMRDWPWLVTIVDMVWGTLLTAAAALGGHLATRRLA